MIGIHIIIMIQKLFYNIEKERIEDISTNINHMIDLKIHFIILIFLKAHIMTITMRRPKKLLKKKKMIYMTHLYLQNLKERKMKVRFI